MIEALFEDWIWYVALGATIGGLANLLVQQNRPSIFVDCAAGLAGSIAGGSLAWFWDDYFRPGNFALILSAFGAVVFIAGFRKLRKKDV